MLFYGEKTGEKIFARGDYHIIAALAGGGRGVFISCDLSALQSPGDKLPVFLEKCQQRAVSVRNRGIIIHLFRVAE